MYVIDKGGAVQGAVAAIAVDFTFLGIYGVTRCGGICVPVVWQPGSFVGTDSVEHLAGAFQVPAVAPVPLGDSERDLAEAPGTGVHRAKPDVRLLPFAEDGFGRRYLLSRTGVDQMLAPLLVEDHDVVDGPPTVCFCG